MLVELLREEAKSQDLVSIPSEILENLSNHVAELKRYIRLSADRKSINTQLREEELRIISQLIDHILRLRMNKIIRAALNKEVPNNMLDFESVIYGELSEVIKTYEELIKQASGDLDLRPSFRREKKTELLVFNKQMPAVVGGSGRKLGPFAAGDLANLRLEDANLLEDRGYARRVPEPKKPKRS